MRKSLHSRRVGRCVLGLVAAAVLAGGCSVPTGESEGTGVTSEALSSDGNTIFMGAQPGDPNAPQTCVLGRISVPPALAPYGCTNGVLYTDGGATYIGQVFYYAFACPAGTPILPTLGLAPSNHPPTYYSEYVSAETQVTYVDNKCFGAPDSGWIIIVDEIDHSGPADPCVGENCNDEGFPTPSPIGGGLKL